ncbi:MAG: NAD-dependent epimerase/dehydratase family protein [Pseudomonadota bacterium]
MIINDLEEIFPQMAQDLRVWEGQNLLITGGTGFFGKWFLEAFRFARESKQIGFGRVHVLSRDPESFISQFPHLQDFDFIQGDIRSFKFPKMKIHGLIHGATTASARLNSENPNEMFDTIVEGTRRALMCAKESPGCRFLMISSGAVYGKKSLTDGLSKEEDFNFLEQRKIGDAYADGKREAERMVATQECGQSAVIARCFAFVGPYLPLREHFAVGNFIANALDGKEMLVKGDGTPRRTYLYPSDLVQWLFAIFGRGKQNRPYNVGSDVLVSIEEIARTVNEAAVTLGLKEVPIKILQKAGKNCEITCYAPNIQRAQKELELTCKISLGEAVKRTLKYHLEKKC